MRRIRALFKRLGRGIGHFFTHWSVKKVILLLLLAAAIGGGIWFWRQRALSAKMAAAASGAYTRTVTLQKTTLADSVTVTGTVESTGLANVTSTATYPVTAINVQEGDTVTAGEVLATLDTTDLDKEIAKAKEKLAEGLSTAQDNYDKAVETRDKALANAEA